MDKRTDIGKSARKYPGKVRVWGFPEDCLINPKISMAGYLEGTTLGRDYSVVTTNGVFDIIHAGHIRSLITAKRMGNYLIVLLNSDSSAEQLKGDGRPLVCAFHRATVLAALQCVDLVLVFNETTPCDALSKLISMGVCPKYHVKGLDYLDKDIPERAIIEEAGGEVVLVDSGLSLSTSGIIDKIKEVNQNETTECNRNIGNRAGQRC